MSMSQRCGRSVRDFEGHVQQKLRWLCRIDLFGSLREESAFLDASRRSQGGEEAEDVFFLTSARLVPEDEDTAFDVYDAHMCSAAAPCSAATVTTPPCETADSCRSTSAPSRRSFRRRRATPSLVLATSRRRPLSTAQRARGSSHGRCVDVKARRKKRRTTKRPIDHRKGGR